MRILVDVLLLLSALLYQATLSAHLQVRGVGIDLLAVILACIGIVQNWLYSALGGLLCGLVLDGIFGQTGYWSLQYMIFGLAVGLMNEKMRIGQWIFPALSVLAAFVLKEMVPVVYLYLVSAQVGWGYAFLKILVSSAVCTAVFLPVLWLIRRLHRWDVISAPVFNFHGRRW